MESTKKFRLTEEVKIYNGVELHRIEALKDFSDVKKGEKGGWVQFESNLSQQGGCWIFDDAIIYGDAIITDEARVCNNAIIEGNAHVYGNAFVCDNAIIGGNARIYGDAYVCLYAVVTGNATVCDNAIATGVIFNNF